jgi:hypothetical protein
MSGMETVEPLAVAPLHNDSAYDESEEQAECGGQDFPGAVGVALGVEVQDRAGTGQHLAWRFHVARARRKPGSAFTSTAPPAEARPS